MLPICVQKEILKLFIDREKKCLLLLRVAAKRPGYMIRREMYVLRARRGHNELVIHFSFLARY